MSPIASIASSGMRAATTALQASAHNIANLGTPGFQRQRVVPVSEPGGGVGTAVATAAQPGADLVRDVVDQLAARNAFLTNLAVFKRADEATRSLLDVTA